MRAWFIAFGAAGSFSNVTAYPVFGSLEADEERHLSGNNRHSQHFVDVNAFICQSVKYNTEFCLARTRPVIPLCVCVCVCVCARVADMIDSHMRLIKNISHRWVHIPRVFSVII